MLTKAIEEEVVAYVESRGHVVDDAGHRLVVRNGHLPERKLQTPLEAIPVKQPRVRDKRPAEEREVFHSSILPPYLRKTKGCGSRIACLTMVFKLAMSAQKRWRALNGTELLAEVIVGVKFEDGIKKVAA